MAAMNSPPSPSPSPPGTTGTGTAPQQQQEQSLPTTTRAAAATTAAAATATPLPTTKLHALVVDSGALLKHAGRLDALRGLAATYVTVPGVIDEIRDSKSRHALQTATTVLDLQTRNPTPRSVARITAFARQTGDLASLSSVDLQVLALTLDLEREGCLAHGLDGMNHIRETPKRMIGLGSLERLQKDEKKTEESNKGKYKDEEEEDEESNHEQGVVVVDLMSVVAVDQPVEAVEEKEQEFKEQPGKEESLSTTTTSTYPAPKSWAVLVDPAAATAAAATASSAIITADNTSSGINRSFKAMTLSSPNSTEGGQFDDAQDDDESEDSDESDDDDELDLHFPSLSAAAAVPYEGEDDENDHDNDTVEGDEWTADKESPQRIEERSQEEKKRNLQPISKSGRLYNTLGKYKKLAMPSKKKTFSSVTKTMDGNGETFAVQPSSASFSDGSINSTSNNNKSKILAGSNGMAGMTETMQEEEDDGEGWITNSSDIRGMQTHGGGRMDLIKEDGNTNVKTSNNNYIPRGPPRHCRTACTTTDFAMQNVLLQMSLLLWSVDGMEIKRLKSWVIRCGVCFKIHTPDEEYMGMNRLFCSHCGSGDMMQRVAASVDGKTGRLKLYFSKKSAVRNKHANARGTKFSLPKAGTHNRFQGDLLLREDQLMMGAWNQKVKIRGGGQSRQNAESIFGKDLAGNVGCTTSAMNTDDIRVGFGAPRRNNPNAAKGRERRGKKKKSSDRACGMRRY